MNPSDKLPLSKALISIFLSMLIVSGTATMGWLYFKYMQDRRAHNPAYNIATIIQTGPERESLNSFYLAQLLGLSMDRTQNLYAFDTKEARKRLLASPLIKEAALKRVNPGTIYVDYRLRQPMAYLADYVNMAMDEQGYIFPFAPFFTPKRLPAIRLGLPAFGEGMDAQGRAGGRWHEPLKGRHMALAKEVLDYLWNHEEFGKTHLKSIDVSNAYFESYGKREIVVVMEDYSEKQVDGRSILCQFPRILRLGTEDYLVQIDNYLVLRNYLTEKDFQPPQLKENQTIVRAEPVVIDMRIADLAFIKKG